MTRRLYSIFILRIVSGKNNTTIGNLPTLPPETTYKFWLKILKKVVGESLIPLCPRIFRYGYNKIFVEIGCNHKMATIYKHFNCQNGSSERNHRLSDGIDGKNIDATADAISQNLWTIARNSMREKDPVVKQLEYKSSEAVILELANQLNTPQSNDSHSALHSFDSDYESLISENKFEPHISFSDEIISNSGMTTSEILESSPSYHMISSQEEYLEQYHQSRNSYSCCGQSEMDSDASSVLDFDDLDDSIFIDHLLED
ncbi:hypothetical protein K493DRAFT_304023 [Basidiobolus meristosporus CBS 931.73]|uniref:Uncharacterized protein n=1 Tax=Basidiobolus meristosporus CBS 931.73 TaxID=1314790 RepID=A0A1Y1Y1H5_9FUNG|nr:hypothetical protein K493DRAFT_304023 [Basidiobolus meristosporus CBS 931.73]|eukprot:ORX91484.1 hypothetical protein K493DRAFT_304023 [Basidiobolus meristosporus CBS 931.73]